MKRESIGEVLDKPTTPLKPIGEEGTPARIVKVPESVNVAAESGLDFRPMLKRREKTGSSYDKSEAEDKSKSEAAERPQSIFSGEQTEKWDEPLPEKITFQQQVDIIAELKCVYSRPNAKVRWYKNRKEIFSDGLKYKTIINKAQISLIINNPDTDNSGDYTCEANSVPTHSLVTVDDPSIIFFNPLPNTQEANDNYWTRIKCWIANEKNALKCFKGLIAFIFFSLLIFLLLANEMDYSLAMFCLGSFGSVANILINDCKCYKQNIPIKVALAIVFNSAGGVLFYLKIMEEDESKKRIFAFSYSMLILDLFPFFCLTYGYLGDLIANNCKFFFNIYHVYAFNDHKNLHIFPNR